MSLSVLRCDHAHGWGFLRRVQESTVSKAQDEGHAYMATGMGGGREQSSSVFPPMFVILRGRGCHSVEYIKEVVIKRKLCVWSL